MFKHEVRSTRMPFNLHYTLLFGILLPVLQCQTYVDDATTCSSSCDGSRELPYKTIQEGLDNIYAGALHIKAGTYTGPGNVNLSNTNGATNIFGDGSADTVIDCGHKDYSHGWTLQNGAFTMQGLTIRNCVAVNRSINYNGVLFGGVWGGALWIASTSTYLRDIVLEGNEADRGGAMAIFSNSVFMENSTIQSNRAEDGGGIFIQNAYLKLDNVTIEGNEATNRGGGAYGINGGTVEILGKSWIGGNSAGREGNQIACNNGSNFIVNSESAGIEGDVHCEGWCVVTDGSNDYCSDVNASSSTTPKLSWCLMMIGLLCYCK